jgi:deazaflavin-dependent oxidoreductase (nitroreductase family)
MPRSTTSRLSLWFSRLPVLAYRLLPGYERLFGKRWMLVTTRGHRTGLPRSVLLDLVGHDPASGRYYIQPGHRSAAWVGNVRAHPFVRVQIGRAEFDARVIDASGPEGAEHVFAFTRKHRLQARLVEWLIPELKPPKGSVAEVKEWLASHVLVFALVPSVDPRGARHHPGGASTHLPVL